MINRWAWSVMWSVTAAVLVKTGCEKSVTRSDASMPAQARQAAKITRTGGIAGGSVVVWVYRDGVFNIARSRAGPGGDGVAKGSSNGDGQIEDPARTAELWAAIDLAIAVRVNNFPASDVADAFEYSLEFGGREIRWNEAAKYLPRELQDVADAFRAAFEVNETGTLK